MNLTLDLAESVEIELYDMNNKLLYKGVTSSASLEGVSYVKFVGENVIDGRPNPIKITY